eukprot:scaffold2907_cov161-Amphora_coffeaeformis.AAC.11
MPTCHSGEPPSVGPCARIVFAAPFVDDLVASPQRRVPVCCCYRCHPKKKTDHRISEFHQNGWQYSRHVIHSSYRRHPACIAYPLNIDLPRRARRPTSSRVAPARVARDRHERRTPDTIARVVVDCCC